MKKIIAIVMTALMLLAVLAPAASATTTSPVKKYEDAQKGELLYTVDFRGDAAFTPAELEQSAKQMDYEIAPDGTWVRIKNKTNAENSKFNNWGGLIKDLVATEDTIYSMVYKVKANGTIGKNNSVGIGGWATSEENFQKTNGVYNVYANHNTQDANGPSADQRTALSEGNTKLGETESAKGYVYTKNKDAIAVDADGFVTALIVYNGTTCTFANYYLAEGATDLKSEASWIKFDERMMYNALLDTVNGPTEYMCFWTYAYYNTIDTTIKQVEYYKDYIWADPDAPDTTAATTAATTAKETTAATTAAATKPADTTAKAEEEKGCGGTVTVAGIALVASLGTCAVYVEKKRRK